MPSLRGQKDVEGINIKTGSNSVIIFEEFRLSQIEMTFFVAFSQWSDVLRIRRSRSLHQVVTTHTNKSKTFKPATSYNVHDQRFLESNGLSVATDENSIARLHKQPEMYTIVRPISRLCEMTFPSDGFFLDQSARHFAAAMCCPAVHAGRGHCILLSPCSTLQIPSCGRPQSMPRTRRPL